MKNFKIFNCLGNQMPNRNVITILTRKNNQVFMKEESAPPSFVLLGGL